MATLLPNETKDELLAPLLSSGWALNPAGDALTKTYRFPGFTQAFAFMTAGAIQSEKMDHHPDWRNVYNRVEVLLTTHSAKGLTELDLELATIFDKLAASPKQKS